MLQFKLKLLSCTYKVWHILKDARSIKDGWKKFDLCDNDRQRVV